MSAGKWKAQVYWQGVGYTLGSHASEEQVHLLALPMQIILRSCALQPLIGAHLNL